MVVGTWIVVAWGIVAAVLLGIGMVFDATAAAILGGIVGVGLIGLGAVSKMRSGAVAPMRCPDCGGLVSPNAPYCKHCGISL